VSLTIDLPSSRRALLAEAVAALEARSFLATEAACASLLAADPADMEALLLRGLALAAAGQTAPAARLLDHVAAARADYAHPCRDLDRMLGAAAFATQVRACLDLTPADARLRLMWADCLHKDGDLEPAADALAALLDDGPETAAAHHRLGMVRAELGDIDASSLDWYMYPGIMVVEPAIFELIPKTPPWALFTGLFGPMVANRLPVFGYVHTGCFRTVDDLKAYENLRREFETSPPHFQHLIFPPAS